MENYWSFRCVIYVEFMGDSGKKTSHSEYMGFDLLSENQEDAEKEARVIFQDALKNKIDVAKGFFGEDGSDYLEISLTDPELIFSKMLDD